MLTHDMLHRIAPALFTSRRGLSTDIPGPPPGRFLSTGGALLPWADDSLGHARHLFEQYGDIVALVSGGGTRHIARELDCPGTVLCYGAEWNKSIVSQHEVYSKANLSGSLFPGDDPPERKRPLLSFGAGLFSVNGDDHRRHRRLLAPAFSRKRLAHYFEQMLNATRVELSNWKKGEVRDVALDMRRLTSEIVTATLFGTGHDRRTEEASRHLQDALHLMGKPATKLFAYDFPLFPYRRYLKAAKKLEEQMLVLLSERKQERSETGDMLSSLIRAQDEESGTRLTDQEILGHVSVFFAAGHETTANGLAWTLLLLSAYPHVAERVCQELDSVASDGTLRFENLEHLTYLGWVIKESLRLFTPAPWNGRILTEDTQLGRFILPKGTEVLFSIYETHRISEIYKEPQAFVPERWETLEPSPYEYSPFSAGPRTCIGAAFATMEMKVIIASLLQRFRLELLPQRVDRFAEMVLAPKDGLKMRICPADGHHSKSATQLQGNVLDMIDFPEALWA